MTRKFTTDHEWIDVAGDTATVGITDYAQHQLGDVVFVDLPSVGTLLSARGEAAVVESVKAASDVYAPISGTVVAINDVLSQDPACVNRAPEGEGWFFQLTLKNPDELDSLMDQTAYKAYLESL